MYSVIMKRILYGFACILSVGTLMASDEVSKLKAEIAKKQKERIEVQGKINVWQDKANPVKNELENKKKRQAELDAHIARQKKRHDDVSKLVKAPGDIVPTISKELSIEQQKLSGQLQKLKDVIGSEEYLELEKKFKKKYSDKQEDERQQRTQSSDPDKPQEPVIVVQDPVVEKPIIVEEIVIEEKQPEVVVSVQEPIQEEEQVEVVLPVEEEKSEVEERGFEAGGFGF